MNKKKKAVSAPPEQLLELLAARRPLMAPIVLALREMVASEAPDAIESVHSLYAVVDLFTFARPSDAFIHIVAYEKHVNLGFNQGATLPDPHELIAGTGKKIRHIRIVTTEDLKRPLRLYIRAAIKQAIRPPAAPTKRAPKRALKRQRAR
jgi:hypothetical protein